MFPFESLKHIFFIICKQNQLKPKMCGKDEEISNRKCCLDIFHLDQVSIMEKIYNLYLKNTAVAIYVK